MFNRTRSHGPPTMPIPPQIPDTFEINLQSIYNELCSKYYPNVHLNWLIIWGDRMCRSSSTTNFEHRNTKFSRLIFKVIYDNDVTPDKSTYIREVNETLLHEIVHLYLHYKNNFQLHEENTSHKECFIQEMKLLNSRLDNGLEVTIDHPAADAIIKYYYFACKYCTSIIERTRKVKERNINKFCALLPKKCCERFDYVFFGCSE